MSMVFTQTDTSPTCTLTQLANGVAVATNATARKAEYNGTPGTDDDEVVVQTGAVFPNNEIVRVYSLTIPDGTTLAGGTVTCRMDASALDTDVDFTHLTVCRVNSSCSVVEQLGTASFTTTIAATRATYALQCTITAPTLSAGDTICVRVRATNNNVSQDRTITLYNGLTVIMPFTPPSSDFDVRQVRALAPTSTGTQDFTVSGFGVPRAAMFIFTGGGTDSTPATHQRYSVGFWARTDDVDNQFVSHMVSEDGETGVMPSTAGAIDDAVVKCFDPTTDLNDVNFEAAFDSLVTDGIRLNWSAVDGTVQGYVTCVLFNGVSWAVVDSQEEPGAQDDVVFTGMPGTPDIVILATPRNDSDDDTTGDTARLSFGFAANDGSETQGGVANWFAATVSATLAASYVSTALALVHTKNKAGTPSWARNVDSFDSTGVTLVQQVTAELRNAFIGVLALKLPTGTPFAVEMLTVPSSTGSWGITGVGFQPKFAILCPNTLSSADTTLVDSRANLIGISTVNADEEFCNVSWVEDGSDPHVAKSQHTNKVLDHPSWQSGGTAESDLVGAFTSFDSDGMTINLTSVPGRALTVPALFIGSTPEPVLDTLLRRRREAWIRGAS